MDIETKIELVKRKLTEEVITEEGLREMFENYARPKHYIGFEISGKVHLGTGLCTALKIKDFIEAGIKPMIFLADYHSWINGKMGGDLEQIRKIGTGYFKHAFVSLGLPEDKVDYVLASDIYDESYWPEVLRITKDTTIKRMLRCITIMGRKETEGTKSSAILYPAMQAADIFKLDVQIAHAGMDQRKVHMLAWEIARKQGKKFVSVHGHLLPGLQGVQRMNPTEDEKIDAKMSKSVPGSAIFIHDSEELIKKKINKAHCPEKVLEGNPIIEYADYLILRDGPMKVERPEKFGGDLEIATPEELQKVYTEGKLHPADLKNAVSEALIEKLKPCREYFHRHKHYLEEIDGATVTR
ncbi:TPA: tyrosine--tRNA ligase [Candidatus Micrarchaeota archaeon]|nr:tyrosine--tRNA ligase [Candidatus Micrarchaeota archaeon]